ncbi:hypothetical protein F3Y22_tig00110674pilonHSYRG00137 [Hibiscus syriacus]|uniref:RNase H type-1 domain-containing protein n=1 Tax=Hibiscus syriacus TaxID=106335 RepID=A0A6A2ZYX1_HIBSY|nr:hypothetical protein F3Y22_tig00110674pilonHSYRG00137 [Hibiscus syriacus]
MTVWIAVVKSERLHEFIEMNFHAWMAMNLGDAKDFIRQPANWDIIFGALIWHIWLYRNSIAFNVEVDDNRSVIERGKHLTENTCRALMARTLHGPSSSSCRIANERRARSNLNWTRVNSDGARNRETGVTACGGVIRSAEGEWKMGFAKFIGISSIFDAELWGAYIGLLRAWELQETRVVLEMNSLEASAAIKAAYRDGLNG